MLERTRILAKSGKPVTKEICWLTVEDSAAKLKQLLTPFRMNPRINLGKRSTSLWRVVHSECWMTANRASVIVGASQVLD